MLLSSMMPTRCEANKNELQEWLSGTDICHCTSLFLITRHSPSSTSSLADQVDRGIEDNARFGTYIDKRSVATRLGQPNAFGLLLLVFIMVIWLISRYWNGTYISSHPYSNLHTSTHLYTLCTLCWTEAGHLTGLVWHHNYAFSNTCSLLGGAWPSSDLCH